MVPLERTINREYDPNGNMIKVTSGTEATMVLTYDASDRLKSYTQGDIYASFTYDGEGKRVSKRSGGSSMRWTL
jgi:YD repeat-containing protein